MNGNSNAQYNDDTIEGQEEDEITLCGFEEYDDEPPVLEDTIIPCETKETTLESSTIKYAPFIEPVKINGNLYCIALNWLDKKPSGNIKYMGTSVADTYKRISNGLTTFRVVAKTVKVNYNASKANLAKAESQAIDAILKDDGNHKKGPNDYFLIVNGIHGSHTSIPRHICHLGNTLITTANHENGHSLGLLHSNVLTPKPKEGSSRDGTSFMSIFSATDITTSQSYYMGWRNGMVSLYDAPEKVTYTIQKNDAPLKEGDLKEGKLKAVMLSPLAQDAEDASQKSLFLSYPKFKNGYHLAIHSTYGDKNLGSLLEKVFGNQIEYNGFIIKKISEDTNSITVDISRTPPAKPKP